MKKKGFWFYGLSGSGKTYATKYLNKKIKNSIIVDGDLVRKYISTDLGYHLSHRKIQIARVLGLAKIILRSKMVPIISTVYLNLQTLRKAQNIGIKVIKIERNMSRVFGSHPTYKNSKNVVGKDIVYKNIKSKIIFNDTRKKFCQKLEKLI
jgi:adenylylsulfate kinase-like enzyme